MLTYPCQAKGKKKVKGKKCGQSVESYGTDLGLNISQNATLEAVIRKKKYQDCNSQKYQTLRL